MAAYKEDEYLRQALESVRAQEFEDLEVIVVDDANQGTTREVVEAMRDERIHYSANEKRLGSAGTHWRGFQLSRGRYLAILNHDDLWKSRFLATLVPPLEADPSLSVAFSDHELIDSTGRLMQKETDAATVQYKRAIMMEGVHSGLPQLLVNQVLPMSVAAVWRRAAVREERKALFLSSGPAYDLCLGVFVCLDGDACYYSPTRLAGYRVHERSLTSARTPAWALGAARCWEAFGKAMASRDIKRQAQQKASEAYRAAATASIRSGANSDARTFSEWSMRSSPSAKAAALWILSLAPRGWSNLIVR